MISRIVVVGVLAVGLVLALGFVVLPERTVAGTPSPDPIAIEQIEVQRTVAQNTVERAFLSTVRSGAPRLGANADLNLIAAAKSVCSSLDNGATFRGLLQAYVQQGFDVHESSWFFGVSVGAYCSRHAGKVLN